MIATEERMERADEFVLVEDEGQSVEVRVDHRKCRVLIPGVPHDYTLLLQKRLPEPEYARIYQGEWPKAFPKKEPEEAAEAIAEGLESPEAWGLVRDEDEIAGSLEFSVEEKDG